MLIKRIKIENFRQFKDNTIFEFPDNEKNVTLIVADNGTGKTTLSQAFLWCLYGETSFKVKNLLNIKEEMNMLPGDEKSVSVIMDIKQGNTFYTITRRQTYIKKSSGKTKPNDKTNFRISYTDKSGNTQFMTEIQSKLFVTKILPKELSSFFFFGGERIESMSKEIENGKSDKFREAVNGLAGLDATLAARDHFKPTTKDSVYGQFKKEIDESGDVTVSQYINEIQVKQKEIADNLNRIEEIDPEIRNYEEKRDLTQSKINSLLEAEKVAEEIKSLERDIGLIEDDKIRNINSILTKFCAGTATHFSMPLIKSALEDLQGAGKMDLGIPDMRDTTVHFLIKRGYCICGQKLEEGDEAYEHVKQLIEVLPPKNLGRLLGEFAARSRQLANFDEGYCDEITNQFKNIRSADDKIEKLDYQRQELMDIATDTSEGIILRQRLADYNKTIKNLQHEKVRKEVDVENLEKEVNKLEQDKSKLSQISKSNEKIMLYMEYAKAVYEHFVREYNYESKNVREELERRINEYLTTVFDGEISIKTDEKYNIIINVNANYKGHSKLEESTAQGYAVIFAFISALIQMAKKTAKEKTEKYQKSIDLNIEYVDEVNMQDSFPLVMDAPLSVFDTKRIKHLSEILPSIADQVIFFIKDTDGDVAEKYLEDKVGAKYILIKDPMESVTRSERII